MEARELRIGSVAMQDGELINGITSNTLHKFCLKQINLDPVVLTEDMLLNSGGTRMSDSIVVDRFNLCWMESYKYWYVTDLGSESYITKVEFVHEWQNVWHALNGTELTINP